MSEKRQTTTIRVQRKMRGTTNREIKRFVEFMGGNAPAAKILNCSADMVLKMRSGQRGFRPSHVRAMYFTPGFRLSWKRLFDVDYRPKP